MYSLFFSILIIIFIIAPTIVYLIATTIVAKRSASRFSSRPAAKHNTEDAGKIGEENIRKTLLLLNKEGYQGEILQNVYVPKDNGDSSEIDLLFITPKGIFVIESKNYSGWIFGNESSQYWTETFPNGTKESFYNPIKQNRTHLKWLEQYIDYKSPVFSVIVFSEKCTLKNLTVTGNDARVVKRDELYTLVRDLWTLPTVLSEEQIEELLGRLKVLTEVDQDTKQAHIDRIRRRYNTNEQSVQANPDNICPRCGASLVLRTANRGENKGKEFWGCSRYPHCRYTNNKKA